MVRAVASLRRQLLCATVAPDALATWNILRRYKRLLRTIIEREESP